MSWIVNIVIAFVLIKFVVYPGLGWALDTTHPVVAVVSGSMEHDGSYDDWWESTAYCNGIACTQREHYAGLGITKEMFREYRFKNGFNTGDIIILRGKDPSKIEVGDVIVFQSGSPEPVIHRVVKKWYQDKRYYFQTKGDHNRDSIYAGPLSEVNTREDKVIGVGAWRIPYLGWIKKIANGIFQAIVR